MPAAKKPVKKAEPVESSDKLLSDSGVKLDGAVVDPVVKRPDITTAQIVAGVPIVAELLHAFGVYNLSQAQQDSVEHAVTWGLALIGADAVIRVGRNLARR